jgi:acyl-CoA synthetase (AMP-forming)/AMP-acid ligase II
MLSPMTDRDTTTRTAAPAGADLLSWMARPRHDAGIRFAGPGDTWEHRSYAQLADEAAAVAGALVERGVGPGDTVSLLMRSGPAFVAGLFGAMAAGAAASPIAPPMAFQDDLLYVAHVTSLVAQARPAVILVDDELVSLASGLAAGAGQPAVMTAARALAGAGLPVADRRPGADALVQFTSGSSGRARGVRVSRAALDAHVGAIRAWLAMTPDDVTASWLPTYHDMGLVGCLVTPVVNRSDLWLMQPEQFIRSPGRYLRCFGVDGAVLTAMPNFGLDYLVRRIRPDALDGYDLARWRAVILGGERVVAASMDRFSALLAPHGFRRQALLPAYGLAEATLAVSGSPLGEEPLTVTVDPLRTGLGATVRVPAEGGPGVTVVGCGPPLAGVDVTIVDESRRAVTDGVVGEVVVTGAAVASGYVSDAPTASLTRLDDGTLVTGDAGFRLGGQVFVLGRIGDSVKVRGRTVFAEDLEAVLVDAGIPGSRLAVLLGTSGGRPRCVVLIERPRPDWIQRAPTLLAPLVEGVEIELHGVARQTIVRTSSGKPRRTELWRRFESGPSPADTVPVVV